jgi:hypothetical protein
LGWWPGGHFPYSFVTPCQNRGDIFGAVEGRILVTLKRIDLGRVDEARGDWSLPSACELLRGDDGPKLFDDLTEFANVIQAKLNDSAGDQRDAYLKRFEQIAALITTQSAQRVRHALLTTKRFIRKRFESSPQVQVVADEDAEMGAPLTPVDEHPFLLAAISGSEAHEGLELGVIAEGGGDTSSATPSISQSVPMSDPPAPAMELTPEQREIIETNKSAAIRRKARLQDERGMDLVAEITVLRDQNAAIAFEKVLHHDFHPDLLSDKTISVEYGDCRIHMNTLSKFVELAKLLVKQIELPRTVAGITMICAGFQAISEVEHTLAFTKANKQFLTDLLTDLRKAIDINPAAHEAFAKLRAEHSKYFGDVVRQVTDAQYPSCHEKMQRGAQPLLYLYIALVTWLCLPADPKYENY